MTGKPQLVANDHHWLTDSWQRSTMAGLSQSLLPEPCILTRVKLAEQQEKHSALIAAVQSQALPLFNQMMAHSQSRLILSDPKGFVLRHWGLAQYSDKLANIALDEGVNWLEQYKGTNAIGAAISSRQLVSVIGDEHFIAKHRFMSCTACPIFSATGELVGALDITSEQQKHSQQTLLLISSLAQLVETQLLCQLPQGHYRLDIAAQSHLLGSLWQGVLISDENSCLLGFNPMAKHLLADIKRGDRLELHLGEAWHKNAGYHPIEIAIKAPAEHLGQAQCYLRVQRIKRSTALGGNQSYQGLAQSPKAALSPTTSPLDSIQSQKPSGLRFRDPQLEKAWVQANKVLSKGIPLLVLGETGVGKEHFIKQLHSQSNRKQRPLVAINCAAIPHDLVEAELFGYQGGAYTGANKQGFIGKIRQADGGFLFLDEIVDMPLGVQSRLLRVLQEREVTPIGSNQSIKVDIQVVAASHGDLLAQVEKGLFRQDLYYRLSGLQITLPPLRDRHDSVRIIHKLHRKYRYGDQQLCEALLAQLQAYEWPGNLRQLDNMMQVACMLSEGEAQLTAKHIPDFMKQELMKQKLMKQEIMRKELLYSDILQPGLVQAKKDSGMSQDKHEVEVTSFTGTVPKAAANKHITLALALDEQVESSILAAYYASDTNISRCALALGISRNTLYRKLKKLGIK
jgi:transcriptional regulator of acetoin/glycerol metabolism